jgi:hypothetical protein
MLVINNGMAKSASTLLYSHTLTLVQAACPRNGQDALRALTRSGSVRGTGDFISSLDDFAVDQLVRVAAEHGPVVVKTHGRLTPRLEVLLREGTIKATFNHRDPRDVILSAMDHRVRTQQSETPQFREHTSVAGSLNETRFWCRIACQWVPSGLACVFRYCDLVAEPLRELRRLRNYLGLSLDDAFLARVVEQEQCERRWGRLEFNQGALCRYPSEMSADDISLCNRELGTYIVALGYELPPPTAAGHQEPGRQAA